MCQKNEGATSKHGSNPGTLLLKRVCRMQFIHICISLYNAWYIPRKSGRCSNGQCKLIDAVYVVILCSFTFFSIYLLHLWCDAFTVSLYIYFTHLWDSSVYWIVFVQNIIVYNGIANRLIKPCILMYHRIAHKSHSIALKSHSVSL